MKKVYVIGSLNMDLCISAPYCPKGGETLAGSGFIANEGGKGANQAAAAAKSGAEVYMCGCVGADPFGGRLVSALDDAGADTRYVRRAEGMSTGIAVIIVTGGENRIILDKGANAALCEEDIDRALENAEAGDIFLTQSENPVKIVGYALKRAKEKGLLTIFNPAPADPAAAEYFRFADIVVPNESESEIFGGKEKMFSAGAKIVLTTLGSRGYEIASPAKSRVYPCIRVHIADTTAAGDTFCGGLAAGLARGETTEEAAAFASRAASVACTRRGAMRSIPTRQETETYRGE